MMLAGYQRKWDIRGVKDKNSGQVKVLTVMTGLKNTRVRVELMCNGKLRGGDWNEM